MKLSAKILPFAAAVLSGCFCAKASNGWPADYEGVMLQGFYWDSYTETGWAKLEQQADELSEYFSLIWVPNGAKAASNPGMGYDPVYWFTNYNSSFGTEAQLRSMLRTFKAKGTGIIADVVINHRSGVSGWTDFPAERWNGHTWQIGTEGICSTDEVKDAAGQPKPTGAPDTGEDFNGSRDLDHTDANVQDNCKNYCKFLLDDMGYAGFRYDMVKGYAGQYTRLYNEYSRPQFSVGEYWDGSYDAVAAWIEATGKTSAAFDFPCKYQINKAFANNRLTELVWKANGTIDQPAGMIHYGYPRYAVTFIDNHDTYRDGSKFTSGKVVAANAFILFSPGTPCIFYPHWKAYKGELKKLIAVRKACGIHNMSAVKVLRSTDDCYMAEITGTKGKAVVRIGTSDASPAGYADGDIKASGTAYCVWAKADVPDIGPEPAGPATLGVLSTPWGGNSGNEVAVTPMTQSETDVWSIKEYTVGKNGPTDDGYVQFAVKTDATSWSALNADDRFGAAVEGTPVVFTGKHATVSLKRFTNSASDDSDKAGACHAYKIAPGTYGFTVRFATDGTVSLDVEDKTGHSGIEDVGVGAGDGAVEYFNLQGVKVANPSNGVYLRRADGKVTKVLLK